jgi:hypothetical protein
MRAAAIPLLFAGLLLAQIGGTAEASRFIATPFAETLPRGRYNLWQLALYERRNSRTWIQQNRLDIGLAEGLELGLLNVRPKDRATDTWINVQYQPLKESGWRPGLSVGVWDAFRRGSFFGDHPIGPSPFLSLSKGYTRGDRFIKGGVSYGFTRLHGVFGGAEARILKGTGLTAEFVPPHLRLPRAGAWDFALYQWIGKSVRVRGSWMGGNPMMDIFFTHTVGN